VALVLAVDPDQAHSQTLARLTRELAGHEIVVASACDEAIAAIERQLPDLVLFPLFLSPADEATLTSRLRAFPGNDQPQTLALPLVAIDDPATTSTMARHWFYWFRPHDPYGTGQNIDSRAFAEEIRTHLQLERTARLVSADADPSAIAITPVLPQPIAAAPPAASVDSEIPPLRTERAYEELTFQNVGMFGSGPLDPPSTTERATAKDDSDKWPAEEADTFEERDTAERADGPTPDRTAPFRKAAGAVTAGLGTSVQLAKGATGAAFRAANAGIGTALRLTKTGLVAAAGLVGRAKPPAVDWSGWSRRISEAPRWLRYGAPALILIAGVILTIGLPALPKIPKLPTRAPWVAKPTTGVAMLQSVPDGSEVVVDGKTLGLTPLSATLPAGPHEVEFRYRGVTRTVALEIASGESTELKVDWRKQPPARLQLTSEPSGATVTVDGKNRGITPLTMDDLALGPHVLVFEHAAGTVRRSVKLKANETLTLNVSVYSGWLTLFAPVELQITEDGQQLTLDEHNRVMLSSGHHELQLVNRELGYRGTHIVEVQPGEMTVSTIVLPKTTLSVTSAPGTAEVWIDGVKTGDTPLVNAPVNLGTREVVLRSPTLGVRHLAVTATVKPSQVHVDFSKPDA
jgi:CheY-like chemotaxis protein